MAKSVVLAPQSPIPTPCHPTHLSTGNGATVCNINHDVDLSAYTNHLTDGYTRLGATNGLTTEDGYDMSRDDFSSTHSLPRWCSTKGEAVAATNTNTAAGTYPDAVAFHARAPEAVARQAHLVRVVASTPRSHSLRSVLAPSHSTGTGATRPVLFSVDSIPAVAKPRAGSMARTVFTRHAMQSKVAATPTEAMRSEVGAAPQTTLDARPSTDHHPLWCTTEMTHTLPGSRWHAILAHTRPVLERTLIAELTHITQLPSSFLHVHGLSTSEAGLRMTIRMVMDNNRALDKGDTACSSGGGKDDAASSATTAATLCRRITTASFGATRLLHDMQPPAQGTASTTAHASVFGFDARTRTIGKPAVGSGHAETPNLRKSPSQRDNDKDASGGSSGGGGLLNMSLRRVNDGSIARAHPFVVDESNAGTSTVRVEPWVSTVSRSMESDSLKAVLRTSPTAYPSEDSEEAATKSTKTTTTTMCSGRKRTSSGKGAIDKDAINRTVARAKPKLCCSGNDARLYSLYNRNNKNDDDDDDGSKRKDRDKRATSCTYPSVLGPAASTRYAHTIWHGIAYSFTRRLHTRLVEKEGGGHLVIHYINENSNNNNHHRANVDDTSKCNSSAVGNYATSRTNKNTSAAAALSQQLNLSVSCSLHTLTGKMIRIFVGQFMCIAADHVQLYSAGRRVRDNDTGATMHWVNESVLVARISSAFSSPASRDKAHVGASRRVVQHKAPRHTTYTEHSHTSSLSAAATDRDVKKCVDVLCIPARVQGTKTCMLSRQEGQTGLAQRMQRYSSAEQPPQGQKDIPDGARRSGQSHPPLSSRSVATAQTRMSCLEEMSLRNKEDHVGSHLFRVHSRSASLFSVNASARSSWLATKQDELIGPAVPTQRGATMLFAASGRCASARWLRGLDRLSTLNNPRRVNRKASETRCTSLPPALSDRIHGSDHNNNINNNNNNNHNSYPRRSGTMHASNSSVASATPLNQALMHTQPSVCEGSIQAQHVMQGVPKTLPKKSATQPNEHTSHGSVHIDEEKEDQQSMQVAEYLPSEPECAHECEQKCTRQSMDRVSGECVRDIPSVSRRSHSPHHCYPLLMMHTQRASVHRGRSGSQTAPKPRPRIFQ